MIAAAIPENESERLADLRALQILDTPPEERFDRLIRIARQTFGVPIAYLALIDANRQWFKAKCGLATDETGRDVSFCAYTILQHDTLIIQDARRDERFSDNPLVVGPPYIRFYAGHPLRGPDGRNVGTFCIASTEPRALEGSQLAVFRELAAIAESELNMVDLIRAQRELLETKNALIATQERLARELADAAAYVHSLLPPKLQGRVRTDWRFVSSSQLGGDIFGYHWLDARQLVLYLLDVCGHGVGPSLLSISVNTALRRQALPGVRFEEPAQVLAALNRAFPMDENDNKFFTIWYGVYDVETRELRYSSAGHPPALLFECGDCTPKELGDPALFIGAMPDVQYETRARRIPAGSRLYLFSDGVFEVPRPDGELLGYPGLVELLRARVANPADAGSRVALVLRSIQSVAGVKEFPDDFSLLEVEVD